MNLKQALMASPYKTAICECGSRTYTVRPDEDTSVSLDAVELYMQIDGMPGGVVGRFNSVAHLIDNLDQNPEPKSDDNWLPIGEDGEVIAGA